MIYVNDLCKSYNNLNVISNLTLHLRKNVVTSIIAPNGYGKTTLISMIAGLLHPDSGSIAFGHTITSNDVVIVLSGEKNLYMKNTVEENVYYYAVIRGKSKHEVKANISYYQELFPIYKQIKGKLAEKLSFGQKRLMALFCAIVSDAKCIIIDEVSEGLDIDHLLVLKNAFDEVKTHKTFIISSHDYNFVADAADIHLFLKNGQICRSLDRTTKDVLVENYIELYGKTEG